jgi:hypothetical protein
MSAESSVAGKGAEIMLPPQGNPFKKDQSAKATKAGAATPAEDAPRDLSPAGADEEPMDLTPEDIAARFPSAHDERNVLPSAPAEADSDRTPIFNKAPRFDLEPEPVMAAPAVTTVEAVPPPLAASELAVPEPLAATLVDSMPAPMPESVPVAEAAAPIEAAPAMSAPTVGFQPYNPFAPTSEPPAVSEPAAPPASAIVPAPVTSPALPRAMPPTPTTVDVGQPDEIDRLAGRGVSPFDLKTPVTENEFILQMLITDERIAELWERIEKAERAVIQNENTLPKQREENLENLKAARNLLLGGKSNYEDALRYVAEVESDIIYAGRVRRWSYTYGIGILIYDLVWLGAIVGVGVSSRRIADTLSSGGTLLTPEFALLMLVTILFGAVGGVAKSIFSATTHIIKQDFDRQHIFWYITSPLMGAVMGVFVVLALRLGIGNSSVSDNAVFSNYILGFLAGFQQNVALRLVERAIKLFFSGGDERESEEKS